MTRPAPSGCGLQGLHLTADLTGCRCEMGALRQATALSRLCRLAVQHGGLQPVAELFHSFEPEGSGVTGVVLLAESHLAIHTWPELASVTLDVYVCNVASDNSAKARAVMQRLIDTFAPSELLQHQLERGSLAPRALATRRPALSPSAKASSKTE